MKQLICEMCGGKDLVKQDGVFVCQSCGVKYSVEEAKKIMVEIGGSVTVQNAPQISSLLTLARDAFNSKNLEKAEEFCNQILSMDDKCSEAWHIKGKSIDGQIKPSDDRIDEVLNCFLNEFRALDESNKDENRDLIAGSVVDALSGELFFRIKVFSKQPTLDNLEKVMKTYSKVKMKIGTSFLEFGLVDKVNTTLKQLEESLVESGVSAGESAWKNVVGPNYFHEYFGKSKNPFERSEYERKFVIRDTKMYRPNTQTWLKFIEESLAIVSFLQFIEEHVNEETREITIKSIYKQIIDIDEHVIPSTGWTIMQGYAGTFESYMTMGWHEDRCMGEKNKNEKKKEIDEYKLKLQRVPAMLEMKRKKKAAEAVEEYWKQHPEEKKKLDEELGEVKGKLASLRKQLDEAQALNDSKREELRKERDKFLPSEEEAKKQRDLVRELEEELYGLNAFQKKRKMEIQNRIETIERPKLKELERRAAEEKEAHQTKINERLNSISSEGGERELRDELLVYERRYAELMDTINNVVSD